MSICRSPFGDVHLWPYEYSVIETAKVIEYWAEDELTFHPMKTDIATFNAIIFYARSRGIALADAMVFALGTLVGPVGWFEPSDPTVAADMEAMAERIHRPLGARSRALID